MKQTIAMDETRELVETFMELSKNNKYHIGLSALYCYESMIPEISENKIDGLKIKWPSGIVQYLNDLQINQYLIIKEQSD